ncbi:hypothetical protein [Ichthyenterobacterium magnum]|uniref:Uncharacterized protein n=1 Tax=Ichthyenterobacterium magnum TaxID=1230530 RepID=A0A420DVR4_9FLAO|nr:hypothetical protein [Ichthyenterobacterium magnum]RKE98318.1 hypothetical protein BXY80_0400 [Ichthyenterobacterium magnum]
MAHQAIKLYSLLMYFLAIIAFFFLGLVYAGITEAGKGQMLAGGAIVFGYAVIGAFIGLCLSLIIAFIAKRSTIIKLNVVLTLIIVASFSYFTISYQKRQREKLENDSHIKKQPTKSKLITPVNEAQENKAMAMLKTKKVKKQTQPIMGLGMFTPNFYKNKALYFYSNLTPSKSVHEHIPTDSITFKQLEYGGFDIATAPSWLVPDHLKLDYDRLHFKAKSISHDFIEIVVNTTNNQTTFVDRYAGKLQYWPEFLLGIHSVEFPEPSKHKIYVKPLDYAETIKTPYSFMLPIKIQNQWMYVELQGDDYKAVAKGWIRWCKDGKLLITYNLLS